MKKRVLVIATFSIMLVLCLSLVSAGWIDGFVSWFENTWNKITGKTISEVLIINLVRIVLL